MNLGTFHSLLRRQLRRFFGDQFEVPAAWRGFVAAVDDTYREFDADRGMLERSLEISSNELFQANSEMRAVFQAIPDLLFRVDHQGLILAVKAGATNDLLLEPRQLIGRRIQDIPIEPAGRPLQAAIAQVAQGKKPVTIEYSLPRPGRENFYEARLAPTLDNQIVILIRNNTERRRLQRIKSLEDEISTLETKLASLTRQLENPPSDPAKVTRLGQEYQDMQYKLEERMDEWANLSA